MFYINYNKITPVIILLGFLLQSPGFDLYSHVACYYDYKDPIQSYYLVFNAIIPRYLLLSDLYVLTRSIGLPTGIFAFLLIIFPIANINAVLLRIYREKKISILHYYIFLFSVFILSFFYSGTTVALLWLAAFWLTKKNIFIAGAIFHPTGLVFILIIFFIGRLGFAKIIFGLFIIYLYWLVRFIFFSSFSDEFLITGNVDFDFEILLYNFIHIIESKSLEFSIVLVSIVIIAFINFPAIKEIKISLPFILFALLATSILLMFNKSLFFRQFNHESLLLLYYSWLDFGMTDKSINYLNIIQFRESSIR